VYGCQGVQFMNVTQYKGEMYNEMVTESKGKEKIIYFDVCIYLWIDKYRDYGFLLFTASK